MVRASFAVVLMAVALGASASSRVSLLHHSFATRAPHEVASDAIRARFVEPFLAALDAPSLARGERMRVERTLTAALFDDTQLELQIGSVERNAVDAVTWSGRIEGDEASSVTLVVKDGQLAGSIETRGVRYVIEPHGDLHEVREVDPAAFPAESEPTPVFDGDSARSLLMVPEPGNVIDVLVAYTDDLRASLGSSAAADAAATGAIAATNLAFENSGVVPRVRLAATLEVDYADSGDFGPVLEHMRNDRDGQMDALHVKRDQAGADVVVLLSLYGGNSCGAAYLMTTPSPDFAQSAFAVVPNRCAVANLSFPHELGHLFGLEHDRSAAGGTPAYPYGYGYVDLARQFRDIMAYARSCDRCPRIQYFSNPELTWMSRPLGISYDLSRASAADSVRAINRAAPLVASWRAAVDPPAGRSRAVRAAPRAP